MLIDSHCHLYYEPFISNMQATIEESKKNKIDLMLTISVDLSTTLINIDLANSYPEIYCSIGIHPNNVLKNKLENLETIKSLYKKSNKIIAVGEIGLDYYRNNNKEEQIAFLKKQIQIASELSLPIIIHTRDAEDETLKVIKENSEKNKFLIHCFSGSLEFAKSLLDCGCFISLSGIVTFHNAQNVQEVAKYIPLDRLLVETDSPYLSPDPYRGRTNYPKNVFFVAKKIAEIKNTSIENISNHTSSNFYKFFNLKK